MAPGIAGLFHCGNAWRHSLAMEALAIRIPSINLIRRRPHLRLPYGGDPHPFGVLSSMLAQRSVRPGRNADSGSALIAGKKRGAGVGTACAPGDPAKRLRGGGGGGPGPGCTGVGVVFTTSCP